MQMKRLAAITATSALSYLAGCDYTSSRTNTLSMEGGQQTFTKTPAYAIDELESNGRNFRAVPFSKDKTAQLRDGTMVDRDHILGAMLIPSDNSDEITTRNGTLVKSHYEVYFAVEGSTQNDFMILNPRGEHKSSRVVYDVSDLKQKSIPLNGRVSQRVTEKESINLDYATIGDQEFYTIIGNPEKTIKGALETLLFQGDIAEPIREHFTSPEIPSITRRSIQSRMYIIVPGILVDVPQPVVQIQPASEQP